MSGLWSFRDTTTPLPSLSDAARASLPAAADNDFTYDVTVESKGGLLDDPVKVFTLTTDLDGVIQDAQNEWLERVMGNLQIAPYHLQLEAKEGSQAATSFLDGTSLLIDVSEQLSPEETDFVKGLLRKHMDCNKAVSNCMRQRHPTAPGFLGSGGGGSIGWRNERHGFNNRENGDGMAKKTRKRGDGFTHDTLTKRKSNSFSRSCVAERANIGTGDASQLISCAFVERMERRAAQRRAARLALATSRSNRILSAGVIDEKSVARTNRTAPGVAAPPTVLYDKLPLEMQVALVSLDTTFGNKGEVSCLSQYETIALRWRYAKLRKKAWGRWCRGRQIRLTRRERAAFKVDAGATSGDFFLLQRCNKCALGSPRSMPLSMPNVGGAYCLRWYFVLWVAFIEGVREHRLTRVV